MTLAEIIDAILVIVCGIGVPVSYSLFKTLRNLELDNVKLEQKITHIESNYKQGIAHINEEISEMREDVKKLLKYAYMRAKDEDTKMDL